MTMRKILTMLAMTGALVAGFAAPAQAAISDPDNLPKLPGSERCRLVSQTQFAYQTQCGHVLRTFKRDPRTGKYVQVSIQWVR